MKYTKLKNINHYISESINPAKIPDDIFEMYSVPIYESGHPEYLMGKEISSNKAVVKKDDILLCKINPRINRVWIVGDESDYPNIASSEWIVIRNEQYNPEYLAWYFRTPKFKALMMSEVTGIGGSLTRAQPKRVAEYPVPVIDREYQDSIVERLNKCKFIIDSREKELVVLDDLVKARFVELFGDPVVHLDRGETIKLDTIADRITVGFVGEASNDYVDEGVPYLRTQNVRVNRIDLSGLIHVTEGFHKRNEKSIIHPGDVVISRVGVNRGMAAVIPDSLEEANIANCLIVGNTPNVNPFYLAFYMNMSFGKRPQFGASVGSAQGVINTSILKKWEIYLPKKDLQEKFYIFAKQVDKSKAIVQKSLDETLLLFDSLMQKYFG